MNENSKPQEAEDLTRQLLVRFVDEAAFENREEVLKKHQLKELDIVRAGKLVKVEFQKGLEAEKVMAALKHEKSIKYAEPNFKVSTMPVDEK